MSLCVCWYPCIAAPWNLSDWVCKDANNHTIYLSWDIAPTLSIFKQSYYFLKASNKNKDSYTTLLQILWGCMKTWIWSPFIQVICLQIFVNLQFDVLAPKYHCNMSKDIKCIIFFIAYFDCNISTKSWCKEVGMSFDDACIIKMQS